MTGLTAVSLFAGIGGFDLALQRAGVNVVAAVEIDPACRKILARHFPDAVLFEDVREVTGDALRAAGFVPGRGIITAGFPCQDLSMAGRRLGMGEGTRSGLYWEIDRLLAELQPAWVLLENVPGLLSAVCPDPDSPILDLGDLPNVTDEDGFLNDDEPAASRGGKGACAGGCFPAHGGAMGLVLGSLGDRGYGFAYRVLDAQHFGVPQRRRRVIVVGRAGGDARGPVEVLLEPEGGGVAATPGREARQEVAGILGGRVGGGRRTDRDRHGGYIAGTLGGGSGPRGWAPDTDRMTFIPVAFDASQITSKTNRSNPKPGDPAPALAATASMHVTPVAMRGRGDGAQFEMGRPGEPAFTLRTPGGGSSYPMIAAQAVRRLTPLGRAPPGPSRRLDRWTVGCRPLPAARQQRGRALHRVGHASHRRRGFAGGGVMSVPPLALNCSCSHLDVSHDIRGNGSRGACSISTGATAVPCGCKSFSAADDGALFDLPDEPERGGQHI